MSLQALPDFQAPLQDDGVIRAYYPYEAGSFCVVPSGLSLGTRPDGGPDLLLALVRPSRPDQAPPPGGTIDLRLELAYDLEAALGVARQHRPDATAAALGVAAGFLRLWPVLPGTDLPASLVEAVPVLWNGVGSGRFTLRLPMDAATVFEGLLGASTIALVAHAELEAAGVAPRLPIRVTFDPAGLMDEIRGHAGPDGSIRYAALLSAFREPPASATDVVGPWSGDQAGAAAAAMTDRVRARFGRLVPAPTPGADTCIEVPTAGEVGSGTATWDFSEPLRTARPLVLEFDPLTAARDFAGRNGIDALVTRTVTPALPTGRLPVAVTAHLPHPTPGLLQVGVTLEAPPRPPFRMQTARASTRLEPPTDAATLVLNLSPAEPPDYTSVTFAVPAGGPSGAPLTGPVTARAGAALRLAMDEFPVEFWPVRASPALLDLCTISVTFQPGDGGAAPVTHVLDRGQPSVAFSQPRGVEGGTLSAEARPRDGSAPAALGPVSAAPWSLDLFSFPSYGPQDVTVDVAFAEGASDYAIELLAEGAPESPAAITVLDFTSDQTERTWRYVASSPFHAGYRWREYRSRPPLADWSPVRMPGAPLAVQAGVPAATDAGGTS